ncbi:hypothetical protein EYF80_038636 [Liparis tanakae]|uniref:Uncharacterized protein n=1 Tax=Liparis tanakae TaxID=230148 RepID=A0A4Z2GC60_9TELE|nr:hypothetical protein EYF80_038636 [Liparis tanakae]
MSLRVFLVHVRQTQSGQLTHHVLEMLRPQGPGGLPALRRRLTGALGAFVLDSGRLVDFRLGESDLDRFLLRDVPLRLGGHSFQRLRLGVLVVGVAREQKAEPLPDVRQKHLKDLAALDGVLFAVQARLPLPGHEHFGDQEEERTILKGRVSESLFEKRQELQKQTKKQRESDGGGRGFSRSDA